ncbi:copper resistance protein CopA [Agarivorans sp.]|uniref:copper resistance protein CopA n=1 Tax=Agarivorans sp. TaxID=1872412 RepID=UPI003D0722DE
MKKRLLPLLLPLSLAFALPVQAHSEHCQDSKLGGLMKDMKQDLKGYVDAVKADDKATMQQQVEKLLNSVEQAKLEVPMKLQQKGHPMMDQEMANMDHSQMDMNSNMAGMDHSQMDMNGNMAGMDRSQMDMNANMADMDHSQMPNMEGMDHQTHMLHMAYLEGIEQLEGYFQQLKQAKDKQAIKLALQNIKKHTKDSHQRFRLDCDD